MSNGTPASPAPAPAAGGSPPWLPAELNLDGSWPEIRDRLHDIYQSQIRRGLRFNGLPVMPDGRKSEDEFENGYWHVTSRNDSVWNPQKRLKEKVRNYDPKRSARLPWVAAIVRNVGSSEISVFESVDEPSGRLRTYLWLEEFEFVVVLELRTLPPKGHKPEFHFYQLVTAFCVDVRGYAEDLKKRRTAYKKQLPPKREQS